MMLRRFVAPRLVVQASTLFLSILLLSPWWCHGGMLDEYFYVQDLNTKVHHHVQEYLATSSTRPDFLYDPNYPNGRIVEFYAHWCPHCQVRRTRKKQNTRERPLSVVTWDMGHGPSIMSNSHLLPWFCSTSNRNTLNFPSKCTKWPRK